MTSEEKAEIMVRVPLDVLDDLLSMARRSDPYRKGWAWSAVAVSKGCRLANAAMRAAAAAKEE